MLIRVEIPIDAPSIDRLLRRSFNGEAEANLIRYLREEGQITLGLVATNDDGEIMGYAAFSPVAVEGEELQWVALAPLALDKAWRGQGIGKQLVREGLDTLNEFGYAAVVTLGSPDYYGWLGFEPAARFGLYCRWKGTETTFQIRLLTDDALNGVTGLVAYHDRFTLF